MESKLERLRYLEERLDFLTKEWARELAELTQKRGFDMYKPKFEKKIEALGAKYAGLMVPLKVEQNELADEINKEEEAKRKAKYIDNPNA